MRALATMAGRWGFGRDPTVMRQRLKGRHHCRRQRKAAAAEAAVKGLQLGGSDGGTCCAEHKTGKADVGMRGWGKEGVKWMVVEMRQVIYRSVASSCDERPSCSVARQPASGAQRQQHTPGSGQSMLAGVAG